MKRKLFALYKKYKLAITVALIIIVVGVIGTVLILSLGKKVFIKEYKNNNYIVKYDNTWKIERCEEQSIILKHKKEGKINIEIVNLDQEYKFLTIDDMIDELLYGIESQNNNFKLLHKEKSFVTKNKYDGYTMLYENNDTQVMVVVAKKSDKLIVVTCEANSNYFDILLDSIQNIIYEFDTVEEKFDLTHKLNIEKKQITYEKSELITHSLKETTQYEIAHNNYYVKYSIPTNFRQISINSTNGYFDFKGLNNEKISMSINLYNKNIYEYLDKKEISNIYTEYNHYSNNKDYSQYKETLDKFESKYDSYIYKCSYYYDKAITYDENFVQSYKSELNENIILVYAIDKNHILIIKVSSSKVAIPKELIDMISIDYVQNYSSYIKYQQESGIKTSQLKRYIGYEHEIEELKLKIPEKYQEIDNNSNIYENRYYKFDYNKNLNIYNYEINYNLTNQYSKIDDEIDVINRSIIKTYGNYQELIYSDKKNINNKDFLIYDGGYTNVVGNDLVDKIQTKYYAYIKVLFYQLQNGGYLKIKIISNGKEISEQMLNELTNFETKK